MSPRVFAVLVTALVEAPIVAAFYPARRLRMAVVAGAATTTTNLAMNILLPHWVQSSTAFLLVGEGASFAAEALVYLAVARPVDAARAIAASAFANAASFFVGYVLF